MKRFLSLTIALFILSGVFAQQDFTYDLNAQEPQNIALTLLGSTPYCQAVPLSLKVTFQPDKELVTVEMRANYRDKYVMPPKKKDQYTHLWFPMTIKEVQYKDVDFSGHFKQYYGDSKAVLETSMRAQIKNSQDKDLIRPAFQCNNGQLRGKHDEVLKDEDMMLSLQKDDYITLKIQVLRSNEPVVIKVNNVIPLRAQNDYPQLYGNKYFLKYISNSFTITFNLPEDECAGQREHIEKYKKLNRELKNEYKKLRTSQVNNRSDKDKKEITRNQMHLFYQYKNAYDSIYDTDCDQLRKEFEDFSDSYNKIVEGIITPDSLHRIFNELETLYDSARTESNLYHGQKCKDLKQKAEKFKDLELDEEVYSVSSGAKDTVVMIKNRLTMIDKIECRGSGGNNVSVRPKPTPTPTPTKKVKCQFDEARMAKVLREINRLWTANLKGEKNKNEFDEIKRKTDNYLDSLSESCKENNKEVIESYREAVKNYLNDYK